MSFQIIDKEGVPIGMNSLDKEACEFWGHEVCTKSYVTPSGQAGGNWFDIIGYMIHSPVIDEKRKKGEMTWSDVITSLYALHDSYDAYQALKESWSKDKIQEERTKVLDYLHPYIQLIKHWYDKEYKPLRVES